MASVAGALIRDALGAYPDIPELPPYVYVDAAEQQRRAIRGNISALPEEIALAEQTNMANLLGTQKLYGTAFPKYGALSSATEDALLAYFQGQLPAGTRRALGYRAAAGGIGGVPGGSPGLYDLYSGRAADEAIRYAIGATQGYMRGNPLLAATPRYAVGSSFLSPEYVTNFERAQQDAIFNRNFTANKLRSLPNPRDVALGEAVGGIFDTVESLGKTFTLGGLGGMAGGLAAGMGGGAAGGGGMGLGQMFTMGGLNTLAGNPATQGFGGGGAGRSWIDMLGSILNQQRSQPAYNPTSIYSSNFIGPPTYGSPPYGF